MKFKSELAQRFYNEMSGVFDKDFGEFRKLQESKQGDIPTSELLSVAFAVVYKGIEVRQSICKDAAEIEIQDLAGKEGVKLGMASIVASNMGQ